ncbi:MAG: hypothetical protein KDB23_28185, partial [Planctomycetales bacterium]|nr:hypothetical protein [Planctomycetales bacterium]
FDDLTASQTSYDEAGYTFTSSGSLTDDGGMLSVATDGDEVTVTAIDGSSFDLRRLSVVDSRVGLQSITFSGTSVLGGTISETVSYLSDGTSVVDLTFGDLHDLVDVSWTMTSGQSIDNVVLSSLLTGTGRVDLNFGTIVLEPAGSFTISQSQNTIDFNAPLVDANTYTEDAFILESTGGFVKAETFGSSIRVLSDGSTVTLSQQDGGAFAIYSLDLATTAAGSTSIDFIATTLTGEQITIPVSVDGGTGMTTVADPFLAISGLISSIRWTTDTDVVVDKIVAVGRVQSVMDFADSFGRSDDRRIFDQAGYRLSSTNTIGYFPEGFVRPQSNATMIITSLDGRPFTLQSLDLYHAGFTGGNTLDITFTGTTSNGATVSETVAVGSQAGFDTFEFAQLSEVLSVSFNSTAYFDLRIDNLVASQGLPENAAPSVMPVAVADPVDIASLSAQTIVFKTSNLNDAIGTNDTPSITVDGSEVTSLNGTPFVVEFLDDGGHVVTPVAGEKYIARFRFLGDLVIPDGSRVTSEGDHALSILVENNATIGDNVTFDVSGTDAEVADLRVDFDGLLAANQSSYSESGVDFSTPGTFSGTGGNLTADNDSTQVTYQYNDGRLIDLFEITITDSRTGDQTLFVTGTRADGTSQTESIVYTADGAPKVLELLNESDRPSMVDFESVTITLDSTVAVESVVVDRLLQAGSGRAGGGDGGTGGTGGLGAAGGAG